MLITDITAGKENGCFAKIGPRTLYLLATWYSVLNCETL